MGILSGAAQDSWQSQVSGNRSTPSVDPREFFGSLSLAPGGLGVTPASKRGDALDGVWFGKRAGGDSKAPRRDTVGSSAIADERLRRYGRTEGAPELVDLQTALDRPWAWTAKKWSAEMNRASLAAGKTITSRAEFLQVWETAVKWANAAARSGKPITPYDAMDLMARDSAAISKAGGQTHTSVATSVENITEGQAWTYIQGAVKEAIGRAPTTAELHRFLSKARDIAADNPSVTTTTSRESADGKSTSQTSKSKGGVKEGDLALAAANMAATPEAAAYQVAGKYMEGLRAIMDGPVNLKTNF